MPISPFLGSVLGGFTSESDKLRQEEDAKTQAELEREQHGLISLIDSPTAHPDLKAAATVSLLTRKPGKQSAFQKWYGQAAGDPIFPAIQALMGQQGQDGQGGPGVEHPGMAGPGDVPAGQSPNLFFGPGEREEATSRGTEVGRVGGAFDAAKQYGVDLSPETQERIVAGGGRAALPSASQLTPGTLTLTDGRTVPGHFNKANGEYYDADQNYMDSSQVTGFIPSGHLTAAGSQSTGGKWLVKADPNSSTGYSNFHYDATGKQIGEPVTGAQAPTPPTLYSPVPTPGGGKRFNVKTGKYEDAPGGENAPRPTSPETSATQISHTLSQVDAYVRDALRGELVPSSALAQAKRKKLQDERAVVAGYQDYNDLASQVAAAQGGVSNYTAPPPSVEDVAGQGQAKKGKAKKGSKAGPQDVTSDSLTKVRQLIKELEKK